MTSRVGLVPLIVTSLLAVACGRNAPPAAQATASLRTVRMPDTSKMSAPVRAQLGERFSALEAQRRTPGVASADLGTAYGNVGELLLAARYLDAAELALLNARDLAPDDPRWPYYVAHLYRMRGDLEHTVGSFRDALARKPDDVATRVWLAGVYIDQARYDEAEPLLDAVVRQSPQETAALFQLGRLALARRDFARAVPLLERAVKQDPAAAAIRYPLAMAYRGAGRAADAEAQLRLRDQRNSEVTPHDPLMDRLANLLEGPQAFEVRGTEALNRGEWTTAVETFRQGVDVAPDNPLLRHRLGTALFMTGGVEEAERQFAETLRRSPDYAPAHYSLAVLFEGRGKDADAIDEYAAAVKYQPTYVQARLRLAGVLRRSGRAHDALGQYEEVARLDPRLADAPLEQAITLVRLQRYVEARDRLTAGMQAFPDHPGFPRALARLLAAAPDDRVRDGRRALALAERLLQADQGIDVGETMAMALAETGQYAEAARIQRELIAAARGAGRLDLAARLEENLKLYESRRGCRTPWRDEDVGDVRAEAPDAIKAAAAAP